MLNLVLVYGSHIIARSDSTTICISTYRLILGSNYRSTLLILTAIQQNLIKAYSVSFTGQWT